MIKMETEKLAFFCTAVVWEESGKRNGKHNLSTYIVPSAGNQLVGHYFLTRKLLLNFFINSNLIY